MFFKCITVVMYIMTVNICNYWLIYMVVCLYDMFTGDAAYIQLSYTVCVNLNYIYYYIILDTVKNNIHLR